MLKMLPIPSGPIDRMTKRPVVETLWLTTHAGRGQADLYRPPSRGPHPGILAVLGVVPAGVEHPLVTRLGDALARSGFAALLHRSTTMRDLRLDAGDIGELASAYETLIRQPYVDVTRSGVMGVCVGASFALMAAARPSIRDRVTFVFAYAPYSSMWTLAVDIASGTRTLGDVREPWEVDPLTWKTYVRSVTDWLPPAEAARLRDALEDRIAWNAAKTVIVRSVAGHVAPSELSADGRAALRLLTAGADDVESALRELPPAAKERLTTMSPLSYISDIAAPRIMLLHDRYDHVIPVGESRRLWSVLSGRPGASYTEMGLQHLRMPRGLSPLRLAREIGKTYLAWYPLFRATTA
jgi:dienelactone hydrolase